MKPRTTVVTSVSPHQLRRRWLGLSATLGVAALVGGVIAVPTVLMERHEDVLGRRGRQTTAAVLSSSDRLRWFPDVAEVTYEVEGRQYVTRLTVSDQGEFPVGSTIEVVYDPSNPSHARPVEGWSPSYEALSIVVYVVLGLGVVDSARRAGVTLLLLRTARRPDQASTMRVESFSTRRWWQRWSRDWAALWPTVEDRTLAQQQLYVPIEQLGKPLAWDRPATVLGKPEARRLVVIMQEDRVVWPRGRARSHEPPGRLANAEGSSWGW